MAEKKEVVMAASAKKGGGSVGGTELGLEAGAKPKKKICCACPDTKRLRDQCIVEHGEEHCAKWIDAHLRCLRSEGFKV